MENLPIVHVVNGRQKKLLQGHPWVYGNEIERVEGEIEDGGLVTVVDFRGRYMGTGFYNSKSLITVRLLTHRQEEITDELIASRVKAACDYRRFVMNRPGTDSCRLIYGEADGPAGVIARPFRRGDRASGAGAGHGTVYADDCRRAACMRKAGLPAAAKRRRDSPQRGHGVLHPACFTARCRRKTSSTRTASSWLWMCSAVRRRAISSTRRIITCLCASSARTRACWIASPTSARSRSTQRPPERKK